jgi:hypothetical protein
MRDQENDRNHLACPKCKSIDLDFKGLRNNSRAEGAAASQDQEAVSTTFSWKCKTCKHNFEVTIPN